MPTGLATVPIASNTRSFSKSAVTSAVSHSKRTSRQRKKSHMFSPRSTNYERLEGGLGPSRMSGLRRFGWKKFAIGAVVIIGLVWVFGPRRQDLLPKKYNPSLGLGNVDFEPPPPPPEPEPTHHTTVIGGGTPTAPDTSKAQQPQPRPTSLETDPDVTKTVYCTSPHKPGVPLVQFALMIDAGSTGSRIHIYKFNNCGASPSYEYEVFKQIQPGLSSYRGRPVEAAQSLDPLLDEALKVVPQSFQSCTPVAVKATAGLRLLGSEESESILEAVRHRLAEKYPFSLHGGKDSVVIMDGKDEGVFAWVTANYLLNTIRSDTPPGTTPYAVLDLGGASTQIVFEPSFDMSKPDNTLEEGEHKYDLKFGGKEHVLYQHSYLGYGLKKARGSVHRLVEFMGSFHKPGKDVVVGNPCLARGTTKLVTIEDERVGAERNVTMVGEDIGGFEACNRVVELVMAKDAICEVKPCSFNGVYQPSLLETFPTGKILLLSYFYDRVNPLISSSSSSSPIQISTIATLAQQVCLGRTSWKEHWGHDDELMKELEDRPEWCLDLTFMHALLRLGYEFSSNRAVELGKKIDGTELGWCLGATIAMVGADLKCRV